MNKKGFTIVELLVVIAVLGILVVFVTPKVIELLKTGSNKALEVQAGNVADAAKLYVKDYCTAPISGNTCGFENKTLVEDPDNDYYGFYQYSGRIDLSVLTGASYIKKVKFNGVDCTGSIELDSIEYGKMEVQLKCGDSEATITTHL